MTRQIRDLLGRRWFVITIMIAIYVAGIILDRSLVCNHLPGGVNLSQHECRTTFWWLGLLWPLTFLNLLASSWWSSLLALIVFLVMLFFLGFSLRHEERKSRFRTVLRYFITLLTAVLAAIAAYTVFAYAALQLGWYTMTALITVLVVSFAVGIAALFGSFRFWKGFGGQSKALFIFWFPLLIILLSIAIGTDWLLKHSGGG